MLKGFQQLYRGENMLKGFQQLYRRETMLKGLQQLYRRETKLKGFQRLYRRETMAIGLLEYSFSWQGEILKTTKIRMSIRMISMIVCGNISLISLSG